MAKVSKVRSAKRKRRKKTTTTEEGTSDLTLPTEPNEVSENLSDSIITIFGRKGVGKTSLAAQFPNTLVCMFERGRRNLPILQIPKKDDGPLTWNSFKDCVELALASNDVERLAVDTVDRAYEKCLESVCNDKGLKHPNQANDYGQTWGEIRSEFDAVMGIIKDSGKGLSFISHEQPKPLNTVSASLDREDDDSDITIYERLEPTCSGQAFGIIQEICDYVFYYGFASGKRAITVRSPHDIHWVSCGMSDRFLDPDGNLINTFFVGNSAEEAYQTLLDAHGNKIRDINYSPPRERKERKRRKKS